MTVTETATHANLSARPVPSNSNVTAPGEQQFAVRCPNGQVADLGFIGQGQAEAYARYSDTQETSARHCPCAEQPHVVVTRTLPAWVTLSP